MMSLVFIASALFLGAAVTRRLGLKLQRFEAYGMTVMFGLVLWTWLSFLLALILPFIFSLPITVVLATTAGALLWRRAPRAQWLYLPGGRPAKIVWSVFTAITTGIIGWLMWTHDIMPVGGALYSATATWADFGVHASIINHFIASDHLLLDFPIAAGAHLTYPFMIDLLSSWFVYGGWSLQVAIFVPGILLAAAFLQLMLGFGLRLFHRVGGAILGLSLTLLIGSAVGIFTAFQDFSASGLSLDAFLGNLPQDYTALNTPNAQVTNFIADAFLPQRAFVMGAAVFAAILVLFTHLRTHPSRRLALFAGVIIGLLPLVHAHTFIILGAITASLWVEDYLKTKRLANNWLITGITAIIIAAPQLAWQSLANGTGSGGHFSPGWNIAHGENLLTFWSNNYGLTGLLIIGCAALLLARRELRHLLVWYAPLVIVFVFANIYSLQAFPYDNLKLMLYVFMLTYIFAGYGAVWVVRRNKLAIIPVAIIVVLIGSSGALAVTREFQHQDLFASTDDIALADWVKTNTGATDAFFATDRPNQPIATLGGRPLVSGYRGWLYSYHFDYQPRIEAIQQALEGRQTAVNPYGAKYVAVNVYEGSDFLIDRAAIAKNYQLVYTNASWNVYRLPQ